MKALVTGMAGFIGSHLAARIASGGADVVGIDCFTDYYPREIKEANLAAIGASPRVRFVEAALQTADLARLLDDVTHVFHFAAQAGVQKSWGRDFAAYTAHNVDATQRLLEAVKDRAIARFVYASSSSVYGDATAIPMTEDAVPHPVSPYGVTKLAGEHLCQLYQVNYGVPAVSLRFFSVYGPRQRPDMAFHRFIRAAYAGQPITIYGDGEQTRDFTFVSDAAAAAVAAADRGRPGGVYNIGGGSRVSVNEVLSRIERMTGRTLDVRHEPPQKGDMRDTLADTTRARADLGFLPASSLDAGLQEEIAWLAVGLELSQRASGGRPVSR